MFTTNINRIKKNFPLARTSIKTYKIRDKRGFFSALRSHWRWKDMDGEDLKKIKSKMSSFLSLKVLKTNSVIIRLTPAGCLYEYFL